MHDAPRDGRPPDEPARPALAYRDWRDDRPRRRELQVLGYAAVTALLWIGAVAAMLFFAFSIDYRGPFTPSGTLGLSIACVVWAVMIGSMSLLTVRWYRRPDRRHHAAGMWLGTGIASLVEGICFLRLN